jgi:hypothetical protein
MHRFPKSGSVQQFRCWSAGSSDCATSKYISLSTQYEAAQFYRGKNVEKPHHVLTKSLHIDEDEVITEHGEL